MFPIASLSLVFDILARDNASGTFRNVGNEADRAGKQAESGLARVGGAAKALGGLIVGAGIIEGFQSLYSAAAESERVAARTQNVISSMGNAANISAIQVGDLAGAIAAKTGVDDEAIQSGQNLLLTFGNIRNEAGRGNDIFNRTSQIMVDMSAAMGTDASGSAIQLGKALNDPIRGITALTRVGVSFTEGQKEQIRTLVETGDVMGAQRIILGELERQFGGAAEAMATPLDRARVAVGNVAEEIGTYLVPAVDAAATWLVNDFLPAAQNLGGYLRDNFGPILAGVADSIGFLVGVGADVAGFFAGLPGPIQGGVIALGAFVALKGPVADLLDTIALKALYAKDAIGAAATGGFRGAAGGLVGLLGGPWGIALAGATVGLGYLVSSMGDSDQVTEEAKAAQEGFAAALRDSKGAIDENVRAAAAKAAQDSGLLEVADRAGVSLARVTDAITGQSGALVDVRGQLQQYVNQQTTTVVDANGQVTTSLSREGEAALRAMDSLGGLSGQVGQTSTQQQQLASATQSSDSAMASAQSTAEAFAAEMDAAEAQIEEAKKATDRFKLSLDILTGANVTAIEVESAFQDALDAAKDATKDLEGAVLNAEGSINLQSEAGRKAADVLLDVRNSGNDLIATLKQQGATEDDVRRRDAELRRSFIETAGQMGITGGNAERLADQILGIPDRRNTAITADTGPAERAVNDFVAKVTGKSIVLTGDFRGGAGINVRRAHGGAVFGPGSETSDSIPALLSNNEHVWTAAEVRGAGGHRFIEEMRAAARAGTLAHFAAGGPVLADRYTIPVSVRGFPDPSRISVVDPASGPTGPAGPVGSGALGGSWQSIWNVVKAAIPQARINSTYRPGDPGYHGRNKAIDFGFGTGPGGAGSPGLASINRFLHDRHGRNLAELIYDGIGDDRPDLKNGRPLTYNAGTRAAHRNHVHAAVYDDGGWLEPGWTVAYNGTGQSERIRTVEQERALQGRTAPLVGEVHVHRAVDLDLVLQQAQFRERAGHFG